MSDLFQVHVLAVEDHHADEAAVLVALRPVDMNLLAGNEGGQVLAGSMPEGLLPFRGVDPRQPDCVLGLGGIQYRDGVAVGDFYDVAGEGVRSRTDTCEQQNR